jgi:hypothetical protein
MSHAEIAPSSVPQSTGLISRTALIVAAVFGVAALLVVIAGLHVPIPGTEVVTDPRELFTTLGSGLTGPVGALLIGILAGIMEPGGLAPASLIGHIAGCLWMGFAYKLLVQRYLEGFLRYVGWAALVVVYYAIFVVPGFIIGFMLFHPDVFAELGDSFPAAYSALMTGVIPEMTLTTIITTVVMILLPSRYKKPLW